MLVRPILSAVDASRGVTHPLTSLAIAVFFLVTACQLDPDSRDSSGSIRGDRDTALHAPEEYQELDRSSGCTACIRLQRGVVLGDLPGPGYVVASEYAVRDSLGRHWVAQYRDMLKVFDANGRFLRQVGRAGEGPGEFRVPIPVFTDTDGQVHIVDPGLRRETVFQPDFEVAEINPLPANPWGLAPLSEPKSWVFNAMVQSTEGIGHPFHIVRDARLQRSFGAATSETIDPSNVRRMITTDRRGRIFATPHYEYRIDIFDSNGERIGGFLGPELGEGDPEPDQDGGFIPRTGIRAMQSDSEGRLWVLYATPAPDWRSHVTETQLDDGRTVLELVDDNLAPIYDWVIEVIDVEAGRLLAQGQHSGGYLSAFIGEHEFLESIQTESGIPRLVIWEAEIQ